MMMDERSAQSGYYQEIARSFLKRRGGGLVLSPNDQAVIAAWEEKRVPLDAVLEGIERAFEGFKARGLATRAIPLAFCERAVAAAFAQHRERAAGRKTIVGAASRTDKIDQALHEIARFIGSLDPADVEMKLLLEEANNRLGGAAPDEAALERIDSEIEALLWAGATEAEKAEAAAETKKTLKGRAAAAALEEAVRRRTVMAARARRRIPYVALHYY